MISAAIAATTTTPTITQMAGGENPKSADSDDFTGAEGWGVTDDGAISS